uniref:Uncharacterized protein n=1 Tax=Cacopsylla melanoneura TaxID=428564 RepID=A0A8D8LDC8_9HEMI
MKLIIKFMQPSFVPFLAVLCLSFYQMAYMKYLPWASCLKIVVEFLFITLGLRRMVAQSENFNHCNEIIRRAVYHSQWYRCNPKVKQYVCLILRDTQQPNYLRFLHGFFTLTNNFMMKVFRSALNFINCLKVSGRL